MTHASTASAATQTPSPPSAARWLGHQLPVSVPGQTLFELSGVPGIDAVGFDAERRHLRLCVYRTQVSTGPLAVALREAAETGLPMLFDPSVELAGAARAARSLISFEHARIDQVLFEVVFHGDLASIEKSASLDDAREQLESRRHQLDAVLLGPPRPLMVRFHEALTGQTSAGNLQPARAFELEVGPVVTTAMAADGRDPRLTLGFVSLYDLHLVHESMKKRLFERNIRMGLGEEHPSNRAIRRTLESIVLEGRRSPDAFVFHHNGVTISAQRAEALEDGRLRVVEPRVLNGAQTITTFSRFMAEKVTAEVRTLRLQTLKAIRVPLRLVTDASPAQVVEITLDTNRQTPVEPWNLRASDPVQLELQDKFREELKLNYERQEGATDAFGLEDEAEFVGGKPIGMRKLAMALLAMQGEVSRMHRLAEVFESQNLYTETFPRRLLEVDARRMVLAYKVQSRLPRVMKELVEKNGSLEVIRPAGRNLVWALVLQVLFNGDGIEDFLEEHGRSLDVKNAFTEGLLRASERVRVALAAAVKARPDESTGYLRSTSFFEECFEQLVRRNRKFHRAAIAG
jgi:hypothetical protein